jgi:RNA polymerase sigma-70 factor (ECF subfamily)
MFGFGRLKHKTDLELLEAFRRGRAAAFEELVRRHGEAIEAYACRLLQNAQLAEEVMADTFERLALERGRWTLTGSVRSYLFTIAHNRALDLLRRNRREQLAGGALLEAERSRLRQLNPEARAQLGELAAELEDAISCLPETHREVLLLRLIHGLTGDETAEILGCSELEVRSMLSYARKLLKRALSALERENPDQLLSALAREAEAP